MSLTRFAAAALMAAAAVTGSAATAQAAPEATVAHPQDWDGNCTWKDSGSSVWGACGGSGPEQYEITVGCSDGKTYTSGKLTFGDTKGATVGCPQGTSVSSYGFKRV